jgi:hypothetical protein
MSLMIQGFTARFSAVSAGGEDHDDIEVDKGIIYKEPMFRPEVHYGFCSQGDSETCEPLAIGGW